MKKLPKCKYCNKELSFDNTVLIRIDRFDKYGFSSKQNMFCTACWDNTSHEVKITKEDISKNTDSKDYYSLERDLPDIDLTVEFKDNPHRCGNCSYLILKDYDHQDGTCRITRQHRRFTDICLHEEEMS